jgi:hypothetical protein
VLGPRLFLFLCYLIIAKAPPNTFTILQAMMNTRLKTRDYDATNAVSASLHMS